MSKKYTSTQVQSIYRDFAKSKGWIDHPLAVQAWSEQWTTYGCTSVDEAIESFERQRETQRFFKVKVAMLVMGAASILLFVF